MQGAHHRIIRRDFPTGRDAATGVGRAASEVHAGLRQDGQDVQRQVEQHLELRRDRCGDGTGGPAQELDPRHLPAILESWAGTRFVLGQRRKGHHTDCWNFVDAVLCEWRGVRLPRLDPVVTADTTYVSEAVLYQCVDLMRSRHPCRRVTGEWRLGDVLAIYMRGLPHVALAGANEDAWHCHRHGVENVNVGRFALRIRSVWRPLL